MKIIRWPQVEAMTGKSRSTAYRDEKRGLFPKRVRIGQNAIGWIEDEILDWLAGCPRGFAGGVR